jgi:hypothetical protein
MKTVLSDPSHLTYDSGHRRFGQRSSDSPTDERWEHILYRRPNMASFIESVLDAVGDPEYILGGHKGSLIAVVHLGSVRI